MYLAYIFLLCSMNATWDRVQLKCDGTRWRTGGEVKGKFANGACSQYSSHYLGTWCIQHYYRWYANLGCQLSTELMSQPILNGLVRFGERRNLVSARVPSHFKRSIPIRRSGTVPLIMITCDGKELTLNITWVKRLNFMNRVTNSWNLKNVCNLARRWL